MRKMPLVFLFGIIVLSTLSIFAVKADSIGMNTKGGTEARGGYSDFQYRYSINYTMPSDGEIYSITVYLKQEPGFTGGPIRYAVYTGNIGGGVGELLGYTVAWNMTEGWDGWKTLSMGSNVSLTSGQKISLCIWNPRSCFFKYYRNALTPGGPANVSSYYNAGSGYGTVPLNPGPVTAGSYEEWSIYANYTTGGGNYTLTVQAPSGSGSTNVTTGDHSYTAGTNVTVSASAGAGYSFNHWHLNGSNTAGNPIIVAMNGNTTLQAVFTDSQSPTYSDISSSTTVQGASCQFNVTGNDNLALSSFIFSTNNTGAWLNDTAKSFSATPQEVAVTKSLVASAGVIVGFRWFLNDTTNNWNSTPIQSLTTTAASASLTLTDLGVTDTHPSLNEHIIVYATAILSDGHAVGLGDTIQINGYNFTWNPATSRFEHEIWFNSETTLNFDTVTSATVADYTITGYSSGSTQQQTVHWVDDSSGGGGGGGDGTGEGGGGSGGGEGTWTPGEGGGGGIEIPVNPLPTLPDWSALWNSGALLIILIIALAVLGGELNKKRKKNSDKFRSGGGSGVRWPKSGAWAVLLFLMIASQVYTVHAQIDSTQWVGFALDLTKSNADWETALTKGDKWDFNTIRVVIYTPSYNEAHLDDVLDLISDHGARAILDCHGVKSYFPSGSLRFGSQGLRDWWRGLATKWKDDPRVIAFELYNEPSGATLDSSITSGGVTTQTGIIREYAAITDIIHGIDSDRICIWIDWWGTSSKLPDTMTDPTPYYRQYTMVTFHPYAYGTQTNVDSIVNTRIAEIQRRTAGLWNGKIWCGEIESVPGEPASIRFTFTVAMIRKCLELGYGFNYWHYANTVDDGGQNPDEIIRAAGFTPVDYIPTWTVKATVKSSGTPIQGANIAVSGPKTVNLITDSTGSASFTTQTKGTYTITASKEGYQSGSTTVNIDSGTQSLSTLSVTIPENINTQTNGGNGVAPTIVNTSTESIPTNPVTGNPALLCIAALVGYMMMKKKH